MDFRREDFEIGGFSWIPPTPAKPNSTPNQPICTNWQETHLVQANWMERETLNHFTPVTQSNRSESVTLPWDFQMEAPRHTVPGHYNSVNSENAVFNTWQGSDAANSRVYRDTWEIGEASNSVYGEDLRVHDKFPVNDDTWTNMSFGSLLALANTGNPTVEHVVTTHDFVATSSSFAPGFNPQIGSSQSTMIFGNSSVLGMNSLLGENFSGELNYTPRIPSSESTVRSRPLFDLNAPARTITDADLSENISFQFKPITPAKTNIAEQIQMPSLQDLSVPRAKDAEVNRTMGTNVKGQNEKKQQSHAVTTTGPTQLQENHKPDKGGMEEADFSKTPQQKPRRRKHRPKVIIEGQTKNTPKPCGRKPSVPEESPRFKRTYVRRNGINSPINSRLEGETIEIDFTKEGSTYKDTPVIKRKYLRRKGINKTEASVHKEATVIIDPNTMRYTRSSCRKSLNFESYSPSSDYNIESQPENFSVQDQSTVQSKQGMNVMMEKKSHGVGIAYELTHSTNKVLGDYMSMPDRLSLSPSPTTKTDLPHDYWVTGQSTPDIGKCQIVFTDVMHDKDSTYVSSHLTQETQARGFKRQHMSIDAEAESSNATGSFNNFMQRYLSIFYTPGMHFPTIYKKKRTEKVYNTATSSLHSTMTASDSHAKFERHSPGYSFPQFVSRTNQGSSVAPFEVTKLLMDNPVNDVTQNGGLFGDLLALGPKEGIKKKRSKVPTRVRNLASLIEWKGLPVAPGTAAKASKFEQVREPTTCMEALVADTFSTITTKKRSKRSLFINSTVRKNFNNQALGAPLAIKWKSISPIDWIIEQLNQLDINAESRQVSAQKQKAVKPYHLHYQEQHAIVPFRRGGALVPFDPVKKRRPRPKVDLDDETTRVWKLLLENINSEGVDGSDEEKAKWWEEERRVFKGRADSFIARMHLVQGDRRFSPWKGSVVDSVVGVFLTQNVSDHLSSSAFMSMAADFPLESTINPAESPEERLKTKMKEPEVYILDPDETFGSSNQVLLEPVSDEDAKMLQDLEVDEIRVVNGVKYSGNSSDGSVREENLRDPLQDMSNSGPIKSHESFPNKLMSLIDKERDVDDTFSSETSVISSQNSADSPTAQTEKTEPSSVSNSEEEPVHGIERNSFMSSTSFARLLQMAGTVLHGLYEEGSDKKVSDENRQEQSQCLDLNSEMEHDLSFPAKPSKLYSKSTSFLEHKLGSQTECLDSLDSSDKHNKFSDASTRKQCEGELSVEFASHTTFHKFAAGISKKDINIFSSNADSSNNDKIEMRQMIVEKQTSQVKAKSLFQDNDCEMQGISDTAIRRRNLMDVTGISSNVQNSRKPRRKEVNSNKNDPDFYSGKASNGSKLKGGRIGKEKQATVDWDSLRKQAQKDGIKRERTPNTMDSVDWDAVRCADVNEIAQTIVARGMNHMLAERIKDFLNRLVRDHGSVELEWLRDVPPDKAKEYLLSIWGLGLKSVECVRLLTLHHLAFPVDTNVGRIAVRLGWVPLQPLPESLQLHLLELYPVLESVQKYLWPRLCKLDQKTLYELHYQMITFGKVFCTKNKPNCNACPMRGECRHFASAFASARLALPAPEEKRIVTATENKTPGQNPIRGMNALLLPSSLPVPDERRLVTRAEDKTASQNQIGGMSILQFPSYHAHDKDTSNSQPIIEEPTTPGPIIEMPSTPEPEHGQASECDIEDLFSDDPDEIPTIHFQMEQFTQNLEKVMQQNTVLDNVDMSKALVALTPEAASINVPKLKNVNRLRTEHQVYELPDSHRLLEGMDRREPDDPSPYLLAIWTPGETVDSIEPPERQCSTKQSGELCTDEACLSCNSIREQNSQTVRGTLLIPCRTTMRGSFPLNGTYFQVNEVFSDHESSQKPIDVPRDWLWNLPRRTVYFGTSIPSIFKGLTTEGIQYCFWRGFVCVRGFDRKTRAPRPLIAKFHFPASKSKGKGKANDD